MKWKGGWRAKWFWCGPDLRTQSNNRSSSQHAASEWAAASKQRQQQQPALTASTTYAASRPSSYSCGYMWLQPATGGVGGGGCSPTHPPNRPAHPVGAVDTADWHTAHTLRWLAGTDPMSNPPTAISRRCPCTHALNPPLGRPPARPTWSRRPSARLCSSLQAAPRRRTLRRRSAEPAPLALPAIRGAPGGCQSLASGWPGALDWRAGGKEGGGRGARARPMIHPRSRVYHSMCCRQARC